MKCKTIRNRLIFAVGFFIIVTFFLSGMVFAKASDVSELQKPPIILKASDVLPGEILNGPNYQIEPVVENDGFINTYKLKTDYGPLTVKSTELLMIRIQELKALKQIEKVKKSEAYMSAAANTAAAPLRTVGGLVTDPAGTVSGVTSGVGRLVGSIGSSMSGKKGRGDGILNTATGQAFAKRAYAYKFGVNPYTRYKPLQKGLNDLAWVSASGGLTISAAFIAIPGVAGTVVSGTKTADTMRAQVRDKSPGELDKMNKKKLKEMGVSDSLIKSFLENQNYDAQEMTLLVGELETMKGINGRKQFIEVASKANSESEALFMRLRAQMVAGYHSDVAPVARIVEADETPLLQREDGVAVELYPLDYIALTEDLIQKEKLSSESIKGLSGVTGKELLITGCIDPEARKVLESKGWKVNEKTKYRVSKK